MGLSKLPVQINLRAFTFCPEQEIRQRQHIKDREKTHYKDKEQCGRAALECIKEHKAPPHGLGGYYHQKIGKEHLSTIMPRVSLEKS
jgi:hypothetical protein